MLNINNISLKLATHQILSNITLNISQGETVGLIGPNGSGKTSLFNSISGFVIPQSGKILLRDIDITNATPYKRASLGIGRVFQNFGIFREMTVIENVITALESRQSSLSTFLPWSKNNLINRERAMEFLKEIKLTSKAKDKAGSLSGGQMRLLEIVRTLAFEAELFLLDEPTAGVSPKMKDDVADIIERLKSLKKTVLIIEHDINFIQRFCTRIIVLDVGKLLLDDTPEGVRNNKLLQEIYFGAAKVM